MQLAYCTCAVRFLNFAVFLLTRRCGESFGGCHSICFACLLGLTCYFWGLQGDLWLSCLFFFSLVSGNLHADCLPGGGAVPSASFGPSYVLRTMQASDLLLPSPFGRAFLRLPPWFQEALNNHGFGPRQSDGHVLMLSRLRMATEHDVLVIEDQPTLEVVGDRLTWTESFAHILSSALTRIWEGVTPTQEIQWRSMNSWWV